MKRFLYSFIITLLTLPGFSQVYQGQEASEVLEGAKKVWLKESDATLKYIEFSSDKRSVTISSSSQLEKILSLPKENTLKKFTSSDDATGIQHTRYQLHYNNIPVEGSVFIMHAAGDKLLSGNGELYRIPELATTPKLSVQQTKTIAFDHIKGQTYYTEKDGVKISPVTLVILPLQDKYYLTYRFDVYAKEPHSRHFVYVDAHNGEVHKVVSRIHHDVFEGLAETKYQGIQSIETTQENQVYILEDNSRGALIATLDMNSGTNYMAATNFEDLDNYWDIQTNQDDAATNAHFAIQQSFDYFKLNYNRNSFDNQGADVVSYIHFGSNYVNAFWNGNSFTFGDGDGVNYTALTPLDVVAHEYTHAITQHTAGLEYAYESGALNESFSDIFGVAIDFFVNPSTANYTLGEQFSIQGTAFRDMSNPKGFHNPDTYLGEYWVSGSEDNGGVHTNSGVQNYWFYLLAEGGSGMNDLGHSYSVAGIGVEKAAAIAYRNLCVYLTPYSQYIDARFYSIQSAEDLYGACSPEVIAVTNAWHAVGVGSKFAGDVFADFHGSRNYACSATAEVKFTNTSLNAGTYRWDFGDGNVSNSIHPVHTYTHEGSYSVQLIAEGQYNCSGSDTLVLEDFIQIQSNNNSSDAACIPETTHPDEVGISEFIFKSIHNISSLSLEEGAYTDNTCSFSADLIAGEKIDLEVITGPKEAENVVLWIDLNNDGIFSTEEKLWESKAQLKYHSGSIIVPAPEIYNQALRLRLASDDHAHPIENACGPLFSGQFEDYRVVIHENTDAPIANFILSDSVVGVGENVVLRDRSLYLPEVWSWEMPGASPSYSELQDEEVEYNQPGIYTISLRATNSYGSDSIIKVNSIEVLPSFRICDTETSSLESGLLYDREGANANYNNNESCGFLIQPVCANSIRINLLSLSLEDKKDFIFVYDGVNESGELILEATGSTLPDEVIAESGSAYIVFKTDDSGTDEGFKLRWDADLPPNVPVLADFSMSETQPAFLQTVSFTDFSSNSPVEWLWDFGDGYTSEEKNPDHSYASSGIKEITLYASNCFFSDTIVKTISVLPSPKIEVNPGSFSEVQKTDEIEEYTLDISNISTEGILNYNILVRDNIENISYNKSETFTSPVVLEKSVDTVNYTSTKNSDYISFGQSVTAKKTSLNYSRTGLDKTLALFADRHHHLTDLVPDCHYFTDGTEGRDINDGGNDMYDGGNILSTNILSEISYSNNAIQEHSAFGAKGAYFTSKQDGIFMLAADLDQVQNFSIAGNLGADGAGSVDAGIIMMDLGMKSYTGFVKRVYGTNDPSVNHLIIVPDATEEVSHSIDVNSNSDGHSIDNLDQANRLYYFLFSSEDGGYISDSVMAEIMAAFISFIEPECTWLTAESQMMSMTALSEGKVSLSVNTNGLTPGEYTADIHVLSNDTSNKELIIPFNLQVQEQSKVTYTLSDFIGYTVIGTTLADTSYIINTGSDELRVDEVLLDGDVFDAELLKTDIEPNDSAMLIIRYSPKEVGQDSTRIELKSFSKNLELSQPTISAGALVPPAPQLKNIPDEILLYMDGDRREILLDSIFINSPGIKLYYDIYQSESKVVNFFLDNDRLVLEQIAAGITNLELVATNKWGGTATACIKVIVLNSTDLNQELNSYSLTAYPNPTTDYLTIDGFDERDDMNILRVMDLSGKIIQTNSYSTRQRDNSITMNLSQLLPGIYSIYISGRTGSQTLRIVKR